MPTSKRGCNFRWPLQFEFSGASVPMPRKRCRYMTWTNGQVAPIKGRDLGSIPDAPVRENRNSDIRRCSIVVMHLIGNEETVGSIPTIGSSLTPGSDTERPKGHNHSRLITSRYWVRLPDRLPFALDIRRAHSIMEEDSSRGRTRLWC